MGEPLIQEQVKIYVFGHDFDGKGKDFYLVKANSRDAAIYQMCLWQNIELGICESYLDFKKKSVCHLATTSELFLYPYAD